MKKYIHISLIAILLAGFTSTPARAGDDEAIAAIGGFLAGVITGVIIDDHNDRVHVSVRGDHRSCRSCRKGTCRDHGRYSGKHGPRGHWETKNVRVWVPGYWDVRYNRCGDRIKVWRSGHYTWRKERVWIAYDRHDRHDRRDRHDRDRGYRG